MEGEKTEFEPELELSEQEKCAIAVLLFFAFKSDDAQEDEQVKKYVWLEAFLGALDFAKFCRTQNNDPLMREGANIGLTVVKANAARIFRMFHFHGEKNMARLKEALELPDIGDVNEENQAFSEEFGRQIEAQISAD